jgi:lysophospholipase L1-like esterase
VHINGVLQGTVAATALGSKTGTVALSPGLKMVEIRNGGQAGPTTPARGSFITSLSFNAPAYSAPLETGGLLLYGDSIVNGSALNNPNTESVGMLLRDSGEKVAVMGRGGMSLYTDSANGASSAQLASRIASMQPDVVWLSIGLNDYIAAPWNAATFGTAYGVLLDRLHALLPSASIFAMSPCLVTTETANAQGSTLGAYRTAISTAVSTRAWATFKDGTTIYTTGSLLDGLHPNAAGHIAYKNFIAASL